MRRYELGMSLNYAKSWGVAEAVREFFQNALDQQREDEENKMFFKYEGTTLSIGNKKSRLTPQSLLMGASTKTDNPNMIGEHGEGYKVATVVLMRNGVSVKIYNNDAKEVWESKIVKSRRYDADIVVFDISSKLFKKDCDLVIELEGITQEMYQDIYSKNLNLHKDITNVKDSEYGRVLLDECYSGNVYVDGLFVCETREKLKYGYDFKPSLIKLDRDRGLVDNFDLKFAISKLVNSLEDPDFVAANIKSPDMLFISTYLGSVEETDSYAKRVSDAVYDRFKFKYGEDAIPTSSYEEFNSLKAVGGNAVLISSQEERVINAVPRKYQAISDNVDVEFKLWCNRAAAYLTSDLFDEIKSLWSRK